MHCGSPVSVKLGVKGRRLFSLPQYQISLPTSYDYPIDVLLAEQKRMRRFPTITEPFYVTHITLLEQELQRHSIEEKELRKQLDLFTPNHPEYKSKKERFFKKIFCL